MSDAIRLERGYRRWLKCYPRSYRNEYEAEILAVLLADAATGRRQPELRECWGLLAGGAKTRFWPRVARPCHRQLAAAKLMLLGAAVEFAVAITVWATMSSIRTSLVAAHPAYTSAQWHTEVTGDLDPLVISALVATGFWLLMAWANARGRRWARIAFTVFLALTSFSLINGLAHGSAIYARADLAVGSVLWLVTFAAATLLYLPFLKRTAQ